MTQWEYKVVNVLRDNRIPMDSQNTRFCESLESGLNELGAEGWKLVMSPGEYVLVFVRERIQPLGDRDEGRCQ